jgi:hypothetical protein
MVAVTTTRFNGTSTLTGGTGGAGGAGTGTGDAGAAGSVGDLGRLFVWDVRGTG